MSEHNEEKKCSCLSFEQLKSCAIEKTNYVIARAQTLAVKLYRELQNPVVLVNVILGSSVVVTLLQSYAKYEHRFLQGKSDGQILATAGAAAAILTLDGFLSQKYYKKFDKQ